MRGRTSRRTEHERPSKAKRGKTEGASRTESNTAKRSRKARRGTKPDAAKCPLGAKQVRVQAHDGSPDDRRTEALTGLLASRARLVPLRRVSGEAKGEWRPRWRNWQTGSNPSLGLLGSATGLGWVPGSLGLVVLDVDEGDWEAFARRHPPIVALPTRRGAHLVYHHPDTVREGLRPARYVGKFRTRECAGDFIHRRAYCRFHGPKAPQRLWESLRAAVALERDVPCPIPPPPRHRPQHGARSNAAPFVESRIPPQDLDDPDPGGDTPHGPLSKGGNRPSLRTAVERALADLRLSRLVRIRVGERNDTLFDLVRRHAPRGFEDEFVLACNRLLPSPLPTEEVLSIASSVARYRERHRPRGLTFSERQARRAHCRHRAYRVQVAERDARIVSLLAEGLSYREIGQRVGVCHGVVVRLVRSIRAGRVVVPGSGFLTKGPGKRAKGRCDAPNKVRAKASGSGSPTESPGKRVKASGNGSPAGRRGPGRRTRERRRQIARLAYFGATSHWIAALVGCSQRTVRRYVAAFAPRVPSLPASGTPLREWHDQMLADCEATRASHARSCRDALREGAGDLADGPLVLERVVEPWRVFMRAAVDYFAGTLSCTRLRAKAREAWRHFGFSAKDWPQWQPSVVYPLETREQCVLALRLFERWDRATPDTA